MASVKPNKSGDNRIGIGFAPGGRFRATNVPLRELISAAYGTPQPLAAFQITGGPKWIESDRFDIVAKAPGDPQPGPNGPPSAMFVMLRNLLAERFQLTVHRETKEIADLRPGARPGRRQAWPAAASGGDRLRGDDGGGTRAAAGRPPPPAPGERMPCGMRMFPGNLSGGSSSMAQLTNVLARFVNRTVVDRTGLTGNYDLDLQWTPDQLPQGPGRPASRRAGAAGHRSERTFDLYRRPGAARPEARIDEGPVDVLVIDRAEHPTED